MMPSILWCNARSTGSPATTFKPSPFRLRFLDLYKKRFAAVASVPYDAKTSYSATHGALKMRKQSSKNQLNLAGRQAGSLADDWLLVRCS